MDRCASSQPKEASGRMTTDYHMGLVGPNKTVPDPGIGGRRGGGGGTPGGCIMARAFCCCPCGCCCCCCWGCPKIFPSCAKQVASPERSSLALLPKQVGTAEQGRTASEHVAPCWGCLVAENISAGRCGAEEVPARGGAAEDGRGGALPKEVPSRWGKAEGFALISSRLHTPATDNSEQAMIVCKFGYPII